MGEFAAGVEEGWRGFIYHERDYRNMKTASQDPVDGYLFLLAAVFKAGRIEVLAADSLAV